MLFCSCGDITTDKSTEIPDPSGELSISIPKIGQADAIILKTANNCVIIDCGEEDDGEEILENLNKCNITSVDKLIITHFDKDHVGSAAEIIKNIDIKQIITPNYVGSTKEYDKYIIAIDEKNIEPVVLTEYMTYTMDDVLFEIYPPKRAFYAEGDNDFSLAVSITHGDNNFLFTGDAEEMRLYEILSQTQSEYDFLKVPHHGKYNKFTKSFIESINPKISVITCSNKNPAEDETVKIIEDISKEIFYTKNGDVKVVSNGKTINISQDLSDTIKKRK